VVQRSVTVQWLTFLPHITEVPDLYTYLNTDYPDRCFRDFPQSLQAFVRVVPQPLASRYLQIHYTLVTVSLEYILNQTGHLHIPVWIPRTENCRRLLHIDACHTQVSPCPQSLHGGLSTPGQSRRSIQEGNSSSAASGNGLTTIGETASRTLDEWRESFDNLFRESSQVCCIDKEMISHRKLWIVLLGRLFSTTETAPTPRLLVCEKNVRWKLPLWQQIVKRLKFYCTAKIMTVAHNSLNVEPIKVMKKSVIKSVEICLNTRFEATR